MQLSGSQAGLTAWCVVAEKAEWRSLQDIKSTYRDTDGVPVGDKTYTVFNIGNRFRLITKIEYEYQKILSSMYSRMPSMTRRSGRNERYSGTN